MTIAVAAFAVLFNTLGARQLPLFETAILALHIIGVFAILIPLWVLAPKNSAAQVFGEFSKFWRLVDYGRSLPRRDVDSNWVSWRHRLFCP